MVLRRAVVALVLFACSPSASTDAKTIVAPVVTAAAEEPCEARDPRPHPVSVVIAPDDGEGRVLGLIDGALQSIDVMMAKA